MEKPRKQTPTVISLSQKIIWLLCVHCEWDPLEFLSQVVRYRIICSSHTKRTHLQEAFLNMQFFFFQFRLEIGWHYWYHNPAKESWNDLICLYSARLDWPARPCGALNLWSTVGLAVLHSSALRVGPKRFIC